MKLVKEVIIAIYRRSSSINYFRYEAYVLVGLEVGVGEPVLGHKKSEIVALMVNDFNGQGGGWCYRKT